ncbi:MAG: hypothetical protein EXS08_07850 [Planctomycetes bacterium]|nr:hypothetical protein [Planctomycetota bacterium]
MALRPRTFVLSGALLCGCQAHPLNLGLAPSLLPNVGVAASAAVPLRAGSAWQVEARGTYQFIDDKSIADNGLPEAGDWTQLDLGLLHLALPQEGSAWSTRFGVVGFTARGEPNLVEESGDYLGLYCGVGRFTTFGRGFSFGPELTLVAASGNDPRVLIPQLTWGLRWAP